MDGIGKALFTMENVIIMHLSIVLHIALGESSFKITLRFLAFYSFGIRIWDPIPVDRYQSPSGYIPDYIPDVFFIQIYLIPHP